MTVQEILEAVVPAWVGVWQPDNEADVPPEQFAVYTVADSEVLWADDEPLVVRRQCNVNLWSIVDPTETADAILRAMCAAGWGMQSKNNLASPYAEETHRYAVYFVFTREEAVGNGTL